MLLAHRQAQARQEQLAVLWVPKVACVRYHDGGDRAQPLHNCSCIYKPSHMGVAGGEKLIWMREVWIILDREEQLRHRLVEAASEEIRGTYCSEGRADAGAGAEAQRGIDMLDRGVELARP